jgi:hypothetical protein
LISNAVRHADTTVRFIASPFNAKTPSILLVSRRRC